VKLRNEVDKKKPKIMTHSEIKRKLLNKMDRMVFNEVTGSDTTRNKTRKENKTKKKEERNIDTKEKA